MSASSVFPHFVSDNPAHLLPPQPPGACQTAPGHRWMNVNEGPVAAVTRSMRRQEGEVCVCVRVGAKSQGLRPPPHHHHHYTTRVSQQPVRSPMTMSTNTQRTRETEDVQALPRLTSFTPPLQIHPRPSPRSKTQAQPQPQPQVLGQVKGPGPRPSPRPSPSPSPQPVG